MTKLSRLLKIYKAINDISGQIIAEKLGINESLLNLWESGKRKPSTHMQLEIMSFLLEEEDKEWED